MQITAGDFKAFQDESDKAEGGQLCLLTHGHKDSFEFKIVSQADADRIAAYERQQSGRA